jgi:hypothetical protein
MVERSERSSKHSTLNCVRKRELTTGRRGDLAWQLPNSIAKNLSSIRGALRKRHAEAALVLAAATKDNRIKDLGLAK